MPRFDCSGPTCGDKYNQGVSTYELKRHPFNSSTSLNARAQEDLDKMIEDCGWADHPSYGKICQKCSTYLRREPR